MLKYYTRQAEGTLHAAVLYSTMQRNPNVSSRRTGVVYNHAENTKSFLEIKQFGFLSLKYDLRAPER